MKLNVLLLLIFIPRSILYYRILSRMIDDCSAECKDAITRSIIRADK